MNVVKGALIDADYETVDSRAFLRLFVKDVRGRSLVIYDDSFLPYFYVLPEGEPERLAESIRRELGDSIRGVVRCTMRVMGRETEVLLIQAHHPRDVRTLRERLRVFPGVRSVHEHDILFARRYLIDRRLRPLSLLEMEVEERDGRVFLRGFREAAGGVPELKVAAVDIEVYNPKMAPRSREDPVIMISLADSEGRERVFSWKDSGQEFVEVCESEGEMIERFVEFVRKQDYDVIAGYNTDSFDFPYLKERAKLLGVSLGLGRGGEEVEVGRQGMMPEARIRGRAHVDLYPIVRKHVRLNSYVLENVVEEVLGIEKEKIDGARLFEYWDSGGERLEALMRYSLEDARVTLRLLEEFLPLYMELSTLVGQCLNDVSRMTSGQMVEWLLMRFASERGELIPNHPEGREYERRSRETYTGGYVREPRRGLVERVAVFDFRSLYPSIIVSHNIDPSTLMVGEACRESENRVPELDYCFSTERTGFIPEILRSLIERRAEVKRELGRAKEESLRRRLEVSQQALKILANSFYGYMGYPRARWYRRECAESVAAFARKYIREVMRIAEERFGLEVVYGDTDSLFVVIPEHREGVVEEFLRCVNESMPGMIELEFEGFYRRALFVTKKRYALLTQSGKIVVKGLEFVRRDWAPIARETQREVLRILLEEGDVEKAVRFVREVVERIRRGEVSMEEITIYTQLTKSIESYRSMEPHVVAAKRLRDRGMAVTPGMIIRYVITKGRESISKRAKPAEQVKLDEYDPNYYIENQILPAVQRIFEAIGYGADYLRAGIKQTSLRKWFN